MISHPSDSWTARIDLARRHWRTRTSLDANGIRQRSPTDMVFGVWANANHWAGDVSDVCLHEHLRVDLADPESVTRISAAVLRIHEACLRAERDFPDQVPCMGERLEDGRLGLAISTWHTQNLRPPQDDYRPSEAIPEGVEIASRADPDLWVRTIRDLRLAGLHVEDHLNPWAGPPRTARDCQNRSWQYDFRIQMRDTPEGRVEFRPKRFRSEELSEPVIAGQLRAAADGIRALHALYAPGGACAGTTPNGLPPGTRLLSEVIAERETREKDQEERIEP